MYAKMKEEFGVEAPRRLGVSTPEAVARGVIRAIKKDLPEVIVNPGPIRLLLAAAAMSPRLGGWILERTGADAWSHKVGEFRESQRAEAEQHPGGSGTAQS